MNNQSKPKDILKAWAVDRARMTAEQKYAEAWRMTFTQPPPYEQRIHQSWNAQFKENGEKSRG